MIRFFHTADVHFGVENYGKIDQKTGVHSRFLDFVRSFESCVDQAIDRNVDFFLFCGDAYKTAYPTPTQQKQFLRLLFKLQQKKIPVVVVVGNHDHPLSFGKAHSLDLFNTIPLDGIHVFSKPDCITLDTKSGPIQIVGIPWPMRHNLISKDEHRNKDHSQIASYISDRVGAIIKNFSQKLDKNVPAILAGHLTVSSGLFSGSEKCAVFGQDPVFLPSQLALEPFDYVALGHLHRHQDLNASGKIPIVYSGSTERIDFGERNEKKGFCSVSIDEKKTWGDRCSYKFVELETRPMLQIDVELEAGKNYTDQLVHAIKSGLKPFVGGKFGAIVKIVYYIPQAATEGKTSTQVDLFAVQRACASAMCVVSINPIQKEVVRRQRANVNVTMDFASIIETYLSSKPAEDGVDVNRLKKLAMDMFMELEDGNEKIVFDQHADEKKRRVRSVT